MKAFAAIALFAALIVAEGETRKLRFQSHSEASAGCGFGCDGCNRNYTLKMDFCRNNKPILTGPNKNWMYFFESEDPALSANDGVLVTSCASGGVVDSTVYTKFYNNTSQPVLDNAKYVIYASDPTPIPTNGDLVVEWEGSTETFNTGDSPYPKRVVQSNDVRQAAGLFFAFDFDTYYALAWLLTNDRVYAVYIRYNFGWVADDPSTQYASFSFVIPVAKRKSRDWHNMQVVAHGVSQQISWRLEGREVFRVTDVGNLVDRQYLVVDYGGQEGLAFPTQLYYGFGTVTMINAYPACKNPRHTLGDCEYPRDREALANPTNSTIGFPQYNPISGPPNPAIYYANFGSTVEADFIWGQGTVLSIRKLTVYQHICHGRP